MIKNDSVEIVFFFKDPLTGGLMFLLIMLRSVFRSFLYIQTFIFIITRKR